MENKYQDGEQFIGILFTVVITLISFLINKVFKFNFWINVIIICLNLIIFIVLEKKYNLKSYKIINDNPIARYYSGHKIFAKFLNISFIWLFFESTVKGIEVFQENVIFFIFLAIGLLGPLFVDKFVD